MTAAERRAQDLKAGQRPVKDNYREAPESAVVTMRASRVLGAETLLKLTDRYCVVGQTIAQGATIHMACR